MVDLHLHHHRTAMRLLVVISFVRHIHRDRLIPCLHILRCDPVNVSPYLTNPRLRTSAAEVVVAAMDEMVVALQAAMEWLWRVRF